MQPSIAFGSVYDGALYALTGAYYKMAVDAVGYTDVFGDTVGNFSEISAEQVLTLEPDVVAVAYTDESTRTADIEAVRAVLANTPAVLADRVVEVPGYEIAAGGVSLFGVIDQLAAAGREAIPS